MQPSGSISISSEDEVEVGQFDPAIYEQVLKEKVDADPRQLGRPQTVAEDIARRFLREHDLICRRPWFVEAYTIECTLIRTEADTVLIISLNAISGTKAAWATYNLNESKPTLTINYKSGYQQQAIALRSFLPS